MIFPGLNKSSGIQLADSYFSMASPISCKKFLKEEPTSFYTSDSYYKSLVQAQNAVNGVYVFGRALYASTGLYSEDAMFMLEMPTGQARTETNQSNNNANLLNLTMTASDLYFNVFASNSLFGIVFVQVLALPA